MALGNAHGDRERKCHLKLHKKHLADLAYSPALKRMATCGERSIRMVDAEDWSEVKNSSVHLREEEGRLESIQWTDDGYIISVGSSTGVLYSYLACTPVVNAVYRSRIAYMSSLREISIVDVSTDLPAQRLEIDIEPSFVGLGPNHAA